MDRLVKYWALVALLAGCDPLIEHPRVPTPSVQILSPSSNAQLSQPGTSFTVEYSIANCERVGSLQLLANGVEIAFTQQPTATPGQDQATIPVLKALQDSDWPLSDPARINLQ